MKITKGLQKIYHTLQMAGYECYIVGGAVRNYICGITKICDFDLATNAKPKEIMNLFRHVIPTGIKHGTVSVFINYDKFEITTYRLDGFYKDSRHPEKISFINGVYEDLKRRDFTMNAIAYDPKTHQIIDPSGGINDIHAHLIRAIGNPLERFSEDGLRSLRAIRFVSQLGFRIETITYLAIQQSLHITQKVSKERIISELFHILEGKRVVKACALLFHSGLLSTLFSDLNYSFLSTQSINIHYKFLRHLYYILNSISSQNIELRIAVIFCFSELTKIEDIQNHHYLDFTQKRLKKFLNVAKSYNLPLKLIKQIIYFITWSECPFDFSIWDDVQIRKYLQKLDLSLLDQTTTLWELFCFKNFNEYQRITYIKQKISDMLKDPYLALSVKKLAINGSEIIKNCNLKEGRSVGIILQQLLNLVIEKPTFNKKEILIFFAKKIAFSKLR